MIALEVDIWTFMPITATAEPGVDSSTVKIQSSRIRSLTIDDILDILTDIRLLDRQPSNRMDSLPWEGVE